MGITDRTTFCVLPWIHLNLSPDGRVTLCCKSHDYILDEKGEIINVQTHSLPEIWNSPALRNIRRDMADGKLLRDCKGCVRDEEFGRESHRTYSNKIWLKRRQEGVAITEAIEQSKNWEAPLPHYLDSRMGNLCNLKCTICKPLYSSQIERDPVQAKWISGADYTRLPHRFGAVADWQEAGELSDEIINLSGNLSLIQLAGGEPTINRTQIALLKRLADDGRAKQIDLEVVTNLSNVREDVFKLYARFRTLSVSISADGMGPVYEYVRYPGKWDSLTRNIARLREIQPKTDISINFVLQAINALNVVPFIDWACDEIIRIGISIGRGLDEYNDVRILPPKVREQMKEQFADFARRRANWIAGAPNFWKNIQSMLGELDACDISDDVRRSRIANFMQFVNDMDASRGLSFRSIAPGIYDGVVEYHGYWDQATRFA
jgi:MoaA/NifB/PqqE/SkfB family radical SAM enzyme